jgi:hypothetical protein
MEHHSGLFDIDEPEQTCRNVCCDVSAPRGAVFRLSPAPLLPIKPAIASTSWATGLELPMDAVDAVADLANRSSDYMTDPAVNVHGFVMGNWDESALLH